MICLCMFHFNQLRLMTSLYFTLNLISLQKRSSAYISLAYIIARSKKVLLLLAYVSTASVFCAVMQEILELNLFLKITVLQVQSE